MPADAPRLATPLARAITATGVVSQRSDLDRGYGQTSVGGVTRYSIPVTMPLGYRADAVLAGLVEGLDQIPGHLLRSITFDQGSEWAEWETLAATYGIDCWFCEPHSPWQRGQIENLNRQWRWWFPRGTRLDNIQQADADHAATIINEQRRRHLNYQSPTILYAAAAATVH